MSFRSQQRINKTLKVVYSPERKTQVLENDDRPINCEYCFRMGQINSIFGYLEVFLCDSFIAFGDNYRLSVAYLGPS